MVFDPINDLEFFDDEDEAVTFADELVEDLRESPVSEAAEAVMVCRVVKRYEDDINDDNVTMH